MQKFRGNSNFYYIKSPKHGYANAYPAYPVPPPPDLAYINILPGFSKFTAAIQIPCSEFKKN